MTDHIMMTLDHITLDHVMMVDQMMITKDHMMMVDHLIQSNKV